MGVLSLDELPEFSRAALEALRQPLETGRVSIARANSHVTYPARVQLIAAMNPCRCGYLAEPGRACGRAPRCAQDYTARLSGPLLDRIDMHIDVPAVSPADLGLPPPADYQGRSLLQPERGMALFFADYSLGFFGLRDGDWKFIHELDSGRSKLFHLCSDPGETNDLARELPERVGEYLSRLQQWSAAQKDLILRCQR